MPRAVGRGSVGLVRAECVANPAPDLPQRRTAAGVAAAGEAGVVRSACRPGAVYPHAWPGRREEQVRRPRAGGRKRRKTLKLVAN